MSRVHGLRTSDRVFFVTVNLRRSLAPLAHSEYGLVVGAFAGSRRKLGFLLYGYVLTPDHWHALIWTTSPLTIPRVVRDVKWIAARALNGARGTSGTVWQHQFWDRFVRHGKEFGDRLAYMHLNPVRKGLVARPTTDTFCTFCCLRNGFMRGADADLFGKPCEKLECDQPFGNFQIRNALPPRISLRSSGV